MSVTNQFVFFGEKSRRIQLQHILQFLRSKLENDVTIDSAILSVVTVCDRECGDKSSPNGIAFIAEMTRMVRVLIDAGSSDIDAVNWFEDTALIIAVKNDLEQIASMLIAAGCDVNRQNQDGQSALNIAAQRDNLFLTRLLLSSGADFRLRTGNGYNRNGYNHTAISNACHNESILQEFIDAGADVNEPCFGDGATPLHSAAQYAKNVNCIALLLRHGALIDATDDNGQTPLIVAASLQPYSSKQNPHYGALAELIVAGASVDVADNEGNTAMHFVCCPDILGCLVAVGADVNKTNVRNESCLERILRRIMPTHQKATTLSILFAAGAEFSSATRSKLLRDGGDGSDGGWQAIFDNPAPFVERWQQRFSFARKEFSIRIFRKIRPRAFSICCALQSLRLPALMTLTILDAYFEPIHGSYHLVSMYTKWNLVTAIKHKAE